MTPLGIGSAENASARPDANLPQGIAHPIGGTVDVQTLAFIGVDSSTFAASATGWALWFAVAFCAAAMFIQHSVFQSRKRSSRENPFQHQSGLKLPSRNRAEPNIETDFCMIAAHDLRAPLRQQTGLLNFLAEDLEREYGTVPAEIKTTLGQINTTVQRMEHLVTDLLDYSLQGSAVPDRISLHNDLEKIAALCAIPRGFTLQVEGHLPDVYAPRTAVETVLRNIVANAVKHHDCDTGHIVVSADVRCDTVELRVADDGPGIDEAARDRIFLPFERGPHDSSGTGLGLALAVSLSRSWGGDVSVHQNHPRGSVFCVTVPVYRAAHMREYPVTKTLASRAIERQKGSDAADTGAPTETPALAFDLRSRLNTRDRHVRRA